MPRMVWVGCSDCRYFVFAHRPERDYLLESQLVVRAVYPVGLDGCYGKEIAPLQRKVKR